MNSRPKNLGPKNSRGALIVLVAALATAAILWTRLIPGLRAAKPSAESPGFVTQAVAPGDVRYVAVGDSYTCGTGATPNQAWPAVLTRDLRAHGVKVGLAANLGVDGWTTQNALDQELPAYLAAKPAFATLMIGVNDTYRPTTPAQFRAELRTLLDRMQAALPDKRRLLLVTIPDYSVTPTGEHYAAMNGAKVKIGLFNATIKAEARARRLPLVDVTPMTLAMGHNPSLVAMDRLHPSAREYALWESKIRPVAAALLRPSAAPPKEGQR